ncbi:DEAD/DEAH box helicase [Rhodomicrobium sp.]|uniref:DEAD/DEAH box helicase n=1 Tax=Rhodomicrobium sp. TaxID=2720632 RepID=UPI0039E54D00
MISQASESERQAFSRLHPKVQRWIYDQGWNELRDIQAKAIGAVLGNEDDVIIAAATAAGKTEAAFLPILTVAACEPADSFDVLYISPLKALINDQFRRLEELAERLELPVVKWHGDAPAVAKAKAIAKPRGIVLITPESIEALLVRRGPEVRRLVLAAKFIVIDELHAFLASERGVHLASLLRRIEAQAGRRIRKIGLSATIGDFSAAQRFLNPGEPEKVQVLQSEGSRPEVKLQVRGYREPANSGQDGSTAAPASAEIVQHLFKVLRGKNNLVFAPRRQLVEEFADGLLKRSEAEMVPNEFFPHHGSLAKGLREEVEERLKDGKLPTTAIATTTLELGIDIGSVESVAQIGPPASIAGLRQRLGRSGRRAGQVSILRIYVTEPDRPEESDIFERLRPDIVQAVAAVQLLTRGWIEPGISTRVQVSTLLHQILAAVRERGGVMAADLYALLCGPGPFSACRQGEFAALLRMMAASNPRLIEQAPDGLLMLGAGGEQLTDRWDFYAVFASDEEYRIVTGERALGTVPIFNPLRKDDYLTFAGRRWIVESVDDKAKIVTVRSAPAGRVPKFPAQEGAPLDDKLLLEMREVYRGVERPAFVDATAEALLFEGREAFTAFELDRKSVIQSGDDTFLFLWRGTLASETFRLALAREGISTEPAILGLRAPKCAVSQLLQAFGRIKRNPPHPRDLADLVENIRRQKYDHLIAEDILREAFARSRVDTSSLTAILEGIV